MAISHSDIPALNFFNLFDLFGENVIGKEQDKKCWRLIEKMSLVLHKKGWSILDCMWFKKHMWWDYMWFEKSERLSGLTKLGWDVLRR